jgi:hypothetical protein
MRIRDGNNSDPGSGMEKSRIRDPGMNTLIRNNTEVKYGVRSQKFIWALLCTVVFIGWDPATPPPPSRILAHIRGRYWSAR